MLGQIMVNTFVDPGERSGLELQYARLVAARQGYFVSRRPPRSSNQTGPGR
jgi:hypothetical protein